MITRATVLILGAGASYPYGYPLGQELVDNLVKDAIMPGSILRQDLAAINEYDLNDMLIRRFGDELRASASPSIDVFLESRSDFLEVGRVAIAAELLRCENAGIFHLKKGWYPYLFNKMRDPGQFESFGENKLSIVTFNYDRSLEYFLYTALKNSFQNRQDEHVENFKRIPIIHVHGQLGPCPPHDGVWPYATDIPPQRRREFAAHLPNFANQIKIIHEATSDTAEFQTAHDVLSRAERVCFLGFGYHELNLKRLFNGVTLSPGVEFFACRYGLNESEKTDVQQLFTKNNIGARRTVWGNEDEDCYRFLREHGALSSS
jgi:hypothetical protein